MRLPRVLSVAIVAMSAVAVAAQGLAATPAAVPTSAEAASAVVTPVRECASLTGLDLTQDPEAPAVVESAEVVGSGDDAYCAVRGWIAIQTDFELRLPVHTWQERYLQLGCGGSCGSVDFRMSNAADTDFALTSNTFAVGTNNGGHTRTGNRDVWAAGGLDNPLRHQYGYLAQHTTAIVAKQVIDAYYGRGPSFSYFAGSSAGGRMAVMEAQRYPDDFDGILAGNPTVNFAHSQMEWMWHLNHSVRPDGSRVLDASAVRTLHDAVMAACDDLDGLADGQLSDPRLCSYDPGAIECSVGESGNCLSQEQVAAARAIYDGPRDKVDKRIALGGQAYGSELSWPGWVGAGLSLGVSQGRFLVFPEDKGPDWTFDDFSFTQQTWAELQEMAPIVNPIDEHGEFNLTEFQQAGGKLIAHQGWADEAIKPNMVPNWYQQIRDHAGGLDEAQSFARVFMIPGVAHISSASYLPYQAEILPLLVDWVENGTAPEKLDAQITDASGAVTRSYPVFAYPTTATYVGPGSHLLAENWVADHPEVEPDDTYDWIGTHRKRVPRSRFPG